MRAHAQLSGFLLVVVMVLLVTRIYDVTARGSEARAPCIACMRYVSYAREQLQKHHGVIVRDPLGCPEGCVDCSTKELRCKPGVTVTWDGCRCCMMCARQAGDQCTARHICDPKKDLDCVDGICRVMEARVCWFNGVKYADGARFNSTCRWSCHCQDGRVVCIDHCAHEKTPPPDSRTCRRSRLVKLPEQCCREWICDDNDGPTTVSSAQLAADRLKREDGRSSRPPTPESAEALRCPEEKRYTTHWSACSVSCGVGESFRHTTDNSECKRIKEMRLCEIRACRMDDHRLRPGECTATVKAAKPIPLTYYHLVPSRRVGRSVHRIRCTSVRPWQPKFCSTCRPGYCCTPKRVKTKQIEFKCDDSQHRIRQWAWVKRCSCTLGACPKRSR